MRNLVILKQVVALADLPPGSPEHAVQHVCADPESGVTYVLTASGSLIGINLAANKVVVERPFTLDSKVVAMQYIPDLNAVCFATLDGDIFVYEPETGKDECVGTIENGVTSMSWSPDFELVVFTTSANTILLMTQDWEPITEHAMDPNALEAPIQQTTSLPRTTWRGDGNFFAVSTCENGNWLFRTWERSGAFHSKSESIAGQASVLSWRPSGELIASVQNSLNKQEVVFFERNGLRHGEFLIRDKCDVLDLQWNAGSDVLALLVQLANKQVIIQLWTTKNYHWYLKQELVPSEGDSFSSISWDLEKPLVLHTSTANGEVSMLELCWDVFSSTSHSAVDETTVAVIDGSKLLLTPIRRLVPPPPMSAATILAPIAANGRQLCFSSVDFEPKSCSIFAKFSDGSCAVYEAYRPTLTDGKPPIFNVAPKIISHIQNTDLRSSRQCLYVNASTVVAVEAIAGDDQVVVYQIDTSSKTPRLMKAVMLMSENKRLLRLAQNKVSGRVIAEFVDGSVSYVDMNDSLPSMASVTSAQFPSPCQWIQSVTMADDEVVIGLNDRAKLYINGSLVSQECNSFAVHAEFFLFTTLSHQLKSCSLAKTLEDNIQILSNKKKYDDSHREVEQGSIIVAVVPTDTRLVLQMPRGNLEVIEPRVLMVSKLRKLINEKRYDIAFTLMRKHRIDLNLLHDHNPQQFSHCIEEFVKQINSIDNLNLFISSLKNENVTETVFNDIWKVQKEPMEEQIKRRLRTIKLNKEKPSTKVTTVCDALRSYFEKTDASRYMLCSITAMVRREPPLIEEALRVVQRLRHAELQDQVVPQGMSAEKALKYLIFLVDVNMLYDIALGMYDFDLVILVAQKSQKDPKEYLSFLAELQKHDKFYQRYLIDKHLKRYDQALVSLSDGPAEKYFAECLALVVERKLFVQAIDIYSKQADTSLLDQVLDKYGDFLYSDKHYGQAALAWRSGHHLEKAMSAYKQHGDWRNALSVAHQRNLPVTEIAAFARELSTVLVNQYHAEDAAYILETYCKDYNTAISTLIQARLWDHAIFMCHKFNLSELVQKDVIPAVVEAYDAILAELNEAVVKIPKYHNRLVVVRANKYSQSRTELAPEIEGSETGSIYSSEQSSESASQSSKASSIRSKASSTRRSRVKPSRKKLSGRKGSPYEEEYLVQELNRLIPSSKLLDEVRYLLRQLDGYGHRDKAANLQRHVEFVLDLAKRSLPLLNSLSPLSREELEDEVVRTSDELLQAIVNPVKLRTIAEIPTTSWRLGSLPQSDKSLVPNV